MFADRFVRISLILLGLASAGPGLRAADSETMAERTLREILAKQKVLLEDAARAGDNKLDQDSVKTQLNSLSEEYKSLIEQSPDFAPAYADYGYFLGKLHMEDEAMKILLKADQLDPGMAMVKNQLGNTLAESGKPLEALNYFKAAAHLNPDEPLYPYQIGTLLYEARDTFLGPGKWTRQQWDAEMQGAFRTAAALAPDRIEFTYRFAESYFDLTSPNWDEAIGKWEALKAKSTSAGDQQVIDLQEARVRLYQGRPADARTLLAQVNQPDLAKEKQKLVAQLPENAKK